MFFSFIFFLFTVSKTLATVPGGIFTCAGEFEQCSEHGECVLIASDCGLCVRNGDPAPFGKYLCPDRKTCVNDFIDCPGTKNTFWDWTLPDRKRAELIVDSLSLEEQSLQLQNSAPSIPKLNIPAYQWWSEGGHGMRVPRATGFPSSNNYGAMWSTERLQAMGEMESVEARATHRYWTQRGNRNKLFVGLNFYAPNINLVRDPRWGRNQEVYSEDPMLTGRLAQAMMKGIQKKITRTSGEGEISAAVGCCKHFAVYNIENFPTSRFDWDAVIGTRDMWETYMPHFEMCVGADKNEPQWVEPAAHVMCSYNSVNGVPTCCNKGLLIDILRDQWSYDGFVVSDYDAWAFITTKHHYCENMTCAAAYGINAGLDQEGGGDDAIKMLPEAVRLGMTTAAKVRSSAIRLFEVRVRLGMFDPPSIVPPANIPYGVISCNKHLQEALLAAEESIILLRNTPPPSQYDKEPLLPFTREKAKLIRAAKRKDSLITVAVIGPAIGGSYLLQANYNEPSAWGSISILEGMIHFACDINLGSFTGHQLAGVDFRDYSPDTASDTNVSVSANTIDECVEKCEKDLSCNYYTFDPSVRTCWFLRDSYHQKKLRSIKTQSINADPTIISGSRRGLAILYRDLLYANISFDTPTLGMPVEDPRACSQLCLADPQCTHFSFLVSGRERSCYLRPSLVSKPVLQKGAVSGASPNKCSDNEGKMLNVVKYAFGCDDSLRCEHPQKDANGTLFSEAIAIAKSSDLTVVVGGLDRTIEEEEIDRKSYNLPPNQYLMFDMIANEASSHTALVALFIHAGAFTFPNSTKPLAPIRPTLYNAVLDGGYPGQMGGMAVANIIAGHANPGAKSAISWYKEATDLPKDLSSESFYPNASVPNAYGYTYRYFKPGMSPNERFDVDFGYGLSYTKFEYRNSGNESASIKPCETLTVNLTIINTGYMQGDEIVQVYLWPVSGKAMDYPHPILRLAAFKRVYHIARGEIRRVSLTLNPLFMTTVTDTNEPSTKPDIYHATRMIFAGEYMMSVGPSQPFTQPLFKNAKGFTIPFVISDSANYDVCKPKN